MVMTRQTVRKSIGNIQGAVYSFTRPDLSSSSVSNLSIVIHFVFMYKSNVYNKSKCLNVELLFWLHVEVIIVVYYHLFIIIMACEY